MYSHPEKIILKFNIQKKLENKRIGINMQNEVICLFTYNWAKQFSKMNSYDLTKYKYLKDGK